MPSAQPESALPFKDSRRLTGSNLFFAGPGAVLDADAAAIDDELLDAWRGRVERAGSSLRWTDRQTIVRRHLNGVLLAISAPPDLLMLATEINEWALCASLVERNPLQWRGLEAALQAAAAAAAEGEASAEPTLQPVIEETPAFARFERLAMAERRPLLRQLIDAAASHALRLVVDDSEATIGTGTGGRSFPLAALPSVSEVRWDELRDIPTALVTGSNGKTTTVRLLAACAQANGWQSGYSCTDGVFIGDELLDTGDYSGPAGARMVLRDRRTQAAILETARGGILRRGIAVSQADVAVITNVSSDHFGEYGIDDLADLADTKLSVASVIAPQGLLVLNADDPQLRVRAAGLAARFGRCPHLGWFALEDQGTLSAYHSRGAPTCGVRNGRLWLRREDGEHDLGLVSTMPLSIGGSAAYNIANLAAAALGAAALGIPPAVISAVFARFGSRLTDNPGRMMRFDLGGARVLIDYAHNPEGLRGLLAVAQQWRGAGRLCLLLGHAGNRQDSDIEELARVAAEFGPDLVVVKENEAQLRGRAPGEVPGILRAELRRSGLPESAVPVCDSEVSAARFALDWARPGDVLVFPIHSQSSRNTVMIMLENRRDAGP